MSSIPNRRNRLAYQEQNSRLTLREGLAEYMASDPQLIDPKATSSMTIGAYFASHDASHVAFGTSTHITDELVQDIWTLLAVDVKYRRYVGELVKAQEGLQVAKALPLWGTVLGLFHLCWLMPRLLTRSFRMGKKWPWTGWEKHLDRPLDEIRQEFGIRVL